MSRTLSLAAKAAIYSQETDAAFLILITLEHDDLEEPLRVSSDGVNTVSRGDTYYAYPFNLSLPDDAADRAPRARLGIDNVDRTIVQAVRGLNSALRVNIEVVLSSDPDTVEASFPDFNLVNVTYDAMMVEGDLTVEEFTSEPWPQGIFSPALFPGLF